ncbi:MAG TPA: carboxypeptidase-like regulatory domain-containing protein, partial [Candidatus Angelobacter sp.]|nr:carboxypeptidase-like regulatory domain-containing protein [Candidatus Angelobacter sp.]
MLKYFFSFVIGNRDLLPRLFYLAALTFSSLVASAQTASIRIVTTDEQSQPVAAVTVQLRLGDKLIALKATDERGTVQFDNLKPDAYAIVVSKDGFETLQLTKVIAGNNTPTIVEFALVPQIKVREKVDVKATDAAQNNPIEQGASPSTDLRREQAKEM